MQEKPAAQQHRFYGCLEGVDKFQQQDKKRYSQPVSNQRTGESNNELATGKKTWHRAKRRSVVSPKNDVVARQMSGSRGLEQNHTAEDPRAAHVCHPDECATLRLTSLRCRVNVARVLSATLR